MLSYVLRRLLFLPVVFVVLSLMIFSLQMLLTPLQRISAYVSDFSELKGGREQIDSKEKPKRRPMHIDSCHVLKSDGEVVKQAWPDYYTGS